MGRGHQFKCADEGDRKRIHSFGFDNVQGAFEGPVVLAKSGFSCPVTPLPLTEVQVNSHMRTSRYGLSRETNPACHLFRDAPAIQSITCHPGEADF